MSRDNKVPEATIDDCWNIDEDKMNKLAEAKPKVDAAREQWCIHPILDDGPDYEEIMNHARRHWEIGRPSAMPCKFTKPASPNGSSWRRPCAVWSKLKRTDGILHGQSKNMRA